MSVLVSVLMCCLGCGHVQEGDGCARARHFDSLMVATAGIDSLEQWACRFREQGESAGLMVAGRRLGRLFMEEGRYGEAMDAWLNAARIARQLRDTLEMVRACNSMGELCRLTGDYSQASVYFYEAILHYSFSSRREEEQMLRNAAASLKGIGKTFIVQKNWTLADSIFRRAVGLDRRLGDVAGEADSYGYLTYINQETGLTDSAWVYCSRSLAANIRARNPFGVALCHMHFGELYEEAGILDKAREEYRFAQDYFAGKGYRRSWIRSCVNLARLHLVRGEGREMVRCLETARKEALETGAVDYLSQIAGLYYRWYEKQGDYRRALDSYVASRRLADSVMDLVAMNRLFNTRFSFLKGNCRMEMETAESVYENARDDWRVVLVTFIVVLVVILSVLAVVLYYMRARRRLERTILDMERVRSGFLASLADAMRPPLVSMLGMCRETGGGDAAGREEVQRMDATVSRQAGQLLDLVDQLRDASRIYASGGRVRWTRGNVMAFLAMAVESAQETGDGRRREVVFLAREKAVQMDFVSEYMEKILVVLLDDVARSSAGDGKVFVSVQAEDGRLLIAVSDAGQPPEGGVLVRDGEPIPMDGTVPGLLLAQQLVLAMDGNLAARGGLDGKRTYLLDFPLVHREGGKTGPSSLPAGTSPAGLLSSDGLPEGREADDVRPVILVVEDNPDVAGYVGSQLKQDYVIKYARNGQVGLEMAAGLIPDLVISDTVMPGMDGYGLCRRIRESELLEQVPVILLSALNTEEGRMRGQEAGADVCLGKPFNPHELDERVAYLLSRREIYRRKYVDMVQDSPDGTGLKPADRQFLNRLVDVAYAVMAAGNVSVEALAGKMCMTRPQLNRKIHSLTGESTVAYLMRIRLNRAKMLLDAPENLAVGDVAQKCGFEDMAYFSRSFKKMYQMTPSQYRKRVRD